VTCVADHECVMSEPGDPELKGSRFFRTVSAQIRESAHFR
jgi:hypothetical protein